MLLQVPAVTPNAQAPAAAPNPLLSFLPLIIILFIFYFMIIMPQQKKQRKHQEMLDALKAGDQVVTIGGLHGKIVEVKVDVVILEVGTSNRLPIRVNRSAIAGKA
ncbi:MAG TPA: preprotein translocase subunit YajC [bacterium]|nr:preprotein translocase subunit YajC [bacterium]